MGENISVKMAGYGFSFTTTEPLRKEAKSLLRAFQLLGMQLDLNVYYKTKIDKGNLTCKISIHGPLQNMQVLENSFSELIEGKYRFESYAGETTKAKKYIRNLFLPTMRANDEALTRITGAIEWLEDKVGGTVSGIVASTKIREQSTKSNGSPLKKLIRVWDETRTKLFQYPEEDDKINKEQTILLDKATETYLKVRLDIKRKIEFPELTDLAVSTSIITTDDKKQMDKFHNKRNKVQHEDKIISDTELYDYLLFLSQLLKRLCSTSYSPSPL